MPQTPPRLLQLDDNPFQNQPEIDRRFCTETVLTLSPLQEPGSPSIHPQSVSVSWQVSVSEAEYISAGALLSLIASHVNNNTPPSK